MVACIKCGKQYPDKEFRERYEELVKQGITPMMIPICKECRERLRKENEE